MAALVLLVPLETEALQEQWEHQVPKDSTVTQERLENKDLPECPVKEVLLVKTERLDLLDLQALLV